MPAPRLCLLGPTQTPPIPPERREEGLWTLQIPQWRREHMTCPSQKVKPLPGGSLRGPAPLSLRALIPGESGEPLRATVERAREGSS